MVRYVLVEFAGHLFLCKTHIFDKTSERLGQEWYLMFSNTKSTGTFYLTDIINPFFSVYALILYIKFCGLCKTPLESNMWDWLKQLMPHLSRYLIAVIVKQQKTDFLSKNYKCYKFFKKVQKCEQFLFTTFVHKLN